MVNVALRIAYVASSHQMDTNKGVLLDLMRLSLPIAVDSIAQN